MRKQNWCKRNAEEEEAFFTWKGGDQSKREAVQIGEEGTIGGEVNKFNSFRRGGGSQKALSFGPIWINFESPITTQ